MLIAFIAFAFATEPTHVPTATLAEEISKEEAYRLAAEAYGQYQGLAAQNAKLRHSDAKVQAELTALGARLHDLECNAGSDDATCPWVPPVRSTSTVTITPVAPVAPVRIASQVADIQGALDSIAELIRQFQELEEREASLAVGIGLQAGLQPSIGGIAGPFWGGVTLVAQTCNEDFYGGFCLGGNGSIGSDSSYGLGADYVRYKKGPHGRFAWGFGVLGNADFVHGLGQAQYDAYHGGVGVQSYLRFTLSEHEKNGKHEAVDLVVVPFATLGQVGIIDHAGTEIRIGVKFYFQRRSGVGGSVAE